MTDEVSHDYWFHFTKSERYYAAMDELREPSVTGDRTMWQSRRGNVTPVVRGPSDLAGGFKTNNPLGKLPGSVWSVAPEPFTLPDELGEQPPLDSRQAAGDHMTGALSLIHGNALSLPLAAGSVHLVVTSPPYHALRSYRDGDEHYDGQLGSEATPHHFLAALWAVLDECWRVLRDDGSCWINLGDKFAGSRPDGSSGNGLDGSTLKHDGRVNPQPATDRQRSLGATRTTRRPSATGGLRPKSRMLLPHRFALGLIDPEYRQWTEHRAGLTPTVDPPQWICRMDVTQSKLNGLPESVTDRVRASHETWFHLVKSERYYAAMDEIREEHSEHTSWKVPGRYSTGYGPVDNPLNGGSSSSGLRTIANPLGKLPGSVWEWANEPLILPPDLPQHFAAFASWPIRRIVSAWSPSGVCVACGQPRRPVCERERIHNRRGRQWNVLDNPDRGVDTQGLGWESSTTITGYVCACPTPDAPTTPARVLDPFSGTGTAPIVAAALGRHGIGVDLSWDYHRIARWRDQDGGLRAKALGVERPEKQLPGQSTLF